VRRRRAHSVAGERGARRPRVRLTLRHADDDELVEAVGEAQVVVLPYRQMHNSGALLLALSLDRRVLVPSGPVTDELAARVGEHWVCTADLTTP
jgi:beta-1,4-mannosyltransferase